MKLSAIIQKFNTVLKNTTGNKHFKPIVICIIILVSILFIRQAFADKQNKVDPIVTPQSDTHVPSEAQPAVTNSQPVTPPQPATNTPAPVSKPDNTAACAQLNREQQSIANSALQGAYDLYQLRKANTLENDSMSDTAKEHEVSYAYTQYVWKVEDWRGDTARNAKQAGCSSTVVVTQRPQ